jgi:hypothetical protein
MNSFKIGTTIIKEEGFTGIYKGLSASLMRQFTYSSARIGAYPLMKDLIQRDKEKPLGVLGKIAASSKFFLSKIKNFTSDFWSNWFHGWFTCRFNQRKDASRCKITSRFFFKS